MKCFCIFFFHGESLLPWYNVSISWYLNRRAHNLLHALLVTKHRGMKGWIWGQDITLYGEKSMGF